MMKEWFRDIPANVFISHARADKETALAFAAWLQISFNLTPFIDSCAWSHAENLLWKLDKTWCPISGTSSFSYELRNITTAHVHIMLSTALTQMMDRCECVFFLYTQNSVSSKSIEQMVSDENHSTHSPWLFHEISMMQHLRRRKASDHREGHEKRSDLEEARASVPTFRYPASMKGIPALTPDNLKHWLEIWEADDGTNKHPLDYLYKANPPELARSLTRLFD